MNRYYRCIACNYKTKDRGNLYHHNRTKKHLKNTLNIPPNLSAHAPEISHILTAPKCTLIAPDFTGKIDDKIVCDYCNAAFTRSNSLLRHKNVCVKKYNAENLLKKQVELLNCKLSTQLELHKTDKKIYATKMKHYTNENDYYKEEAKYYKQMLMEAGGLVKKSVSALTYSITNYDKAPHIKAIDMDEIIEFNTSDIKISNIKIVDDDNKTI